MRRVYAAQCIDIYYGKTLQVQRTGVALVGDHVMHEWDVDLSNRT